MGLRGAKQAVILLLVAALFSVNQAATIVVGGSQGWRSGYNYTEWALQKQPFYYGDTLVFKYDPPRRGAAVGHSVYLLPNLWSFGTCDFKRARRVASPMQGRGQGFSVVLNQWRPYYFASAESNGDDCTEAQMKFIAIPFPRLPSD